MKNIDPNELLYSAREKRELGGKNPLECLPEMFDILLDRQLSPQIQKMVADNDFNPLHAFARWNSGYNEFLLDIYGSDLPEQANLTINPEIPEQDSEHFAENMRALNKILLEMIFKEMTKQNITGRGSPITVEGTIGVIDFFYVVKIIWRCYPQPASVRNVAAQNN
jgi:hypothetical protein